MIFDWGSLGIGAGIGLILGAIGGFFTCFKLMIWLCESEEKSNKK